MISYFYFKAFIQQFFVFGRHKLLELFFLFLRQNQFQVQVSGSYVPFFQNSDNHFLHECFVFKTCLSDISCHFTGYQGSDRLFQSSNRLTCAQSHLWFSLFFHIFDFGCCSGFYSLCLFLSLCNQFCCFFLCLSDYFFSFLIRLIDPLFIQLFS